MLFFQQYNEFVEKDNRQQRLHTPVTAETLTRKHEAMAPPQILNGKTVLDLGSCIGASGHWVLSNGATKYTGVEFQKEYVDISKSLLSKYWSNDQFRIVHSELEKFISESIEKYDIVLVCGIVYGFLNTHGILTAISKVANYCIIVDTSYPTELTHHRSSVIDIVNIQHMIKSDGTSSYLGLGARPSPAALHRLMKNIGFDNTENLIFPKRLSDISIHDAYHDLINREHGIKTPARYIMRFFKTGEKYNSAIENLLENKNVVDLPNIPAMIKDTELWEFDRSVAERFQKEAETHIPDYQKVIDISIEIIENKFKRYDVSIIDVGSALGHTLHCLKNKGFDNVKGIEASLAMIEKSRYADLIIHSRLFPNEKYNVVLAHWTLHFIKEREKYLRDIYHSLEKDGILILTDKMFQDTVSKDLYYKWKMANGVSWEEIKEKEKKLVNVLDSLPIEWYLDTLSTIGFKNINLINSRFNFNTLIASK
jgi:2-polyprenyl-3-methyl-5-hydroxy-6-metoxy-1,4-benzoquinol methylase